MNKRQRNIGFWVRKQKKLLGKSTKESLEELDNMWWFERLQISHGCKRASVQRWIAREVIRDSKLPDVEWEIECNA